MSWDLLGTVLVAVAVTRLWVALVEPRLFPRPPVKITRVERTPLLETEPGRIFTDDHGTEWVALQRTYESRGTLSVTFARGGSDEDPRVKYRIDPRPTTPKEH